MKKYSRNEFNSTFAYLKSKAGKNEKPDNVIAVNYIQNELHEILNSFLNGGFSRKGFALYPLIKDVSKENKKKLSNIIYVLKFLNKSKFSGAADSVENKPLNDFNFASVLCDIYKKFPFKGKTSKTAEKMPVKEFNLSDYNNDSDYLIPIEEIKNLSDKHIKKYSLGFYLHGSLATMDYIKGWSDADTMLVLSKSAFDNPKNLLQLRDGLFKLRRFYCEVDPLQHHGTMIITEFDLNYYPEVFLPVDALKCSKSLFAADKPVKFKIRDSGAEAYSKFRWFADYFQKLEEKNLKNPYDLKFALHLITLFPALYLEVKGKFMYKKFSFEIAEKDFAPEEWKAVKYAENIRNEWKLEGRMPFLKAISRFNPVLAYMMNSKYMAVNNGLKNKVDRKLIVTGMKALSKKALKNVE